jgi:hypothetical protein
MATTVIPDNCAAVTNALLAESGRFGPGIFQRAARKRPIIRLMSKTRGAWMDGMGVTVSAVTFERMQPDTYAGVWANIAPSDGDSVNACLPPTDTASFGQTTRTYTPQHMAINTDHFCIRDIQFDWQYAEMLTKITKGFSDVSEWVWASRYTSEYVRLAGHQIVLQNAGPVDGAGAGYPAVVPTSVLSQGFLNDVYLDLYREGGDLMSGLDEATNEPVFTIIAGAQVLKGILQNNIDIRDDNRYAYMGTKDNPMTPLIPGMPTKRRNYGGFVYEIDPYPRKFTFANGVFTEIRPFVSSSTTKGIKWEQNPAYKAAPIIETIVWHEQNYQSLAVNTVSNPAPGWNFNANNWMGEFSPRNILHETCNPDGTILFWRALFADASKPVNPAVGWAILSLDCPANLDLKDCNGYQT